MSKEFEVTVTVRNNRLKQRRLALGFDTQTAFAEVVGVPVTMYCSLETMRRSPLTKGGVWSATAVKLATFLDCPLDELFPDAVLQVQKTKKSFEIGAEDIELLLSTHHEKLLQSPAELYDEKELVDVTNEALATLRPMERSVLKMHFGLDGEDEHNMREIADKYNLSSARIGQIQDTALRKLRRRGHPEETPLSVKELEAFAEPQFRG